MLLGLSSSVHDTDVDLAPIAEGSTEGSTDGEASDGGVANGATLIRFAEEVHGRRESSLADTRAEVAAAVGDAGLVDAAAVCANFNMMVRIADGTGTPLDDGSVEMSAALRGQLGLDDLESRRVTVGGSTASDG